MSRKEYNSKTPIHITKLKNIDFLIGNICCINTASILGSGSTGRGFYKTSCCTYISLSNEHFEHDWTEPLDTGYLPL